MGEDRTLRAEGDRTLRAEALLEGRTGVVVDHGVMTGARWSTTWRWRSPSSRPRFPSFLR
jgi:hypothetical protein